ncbi:MAG: pyridoxal phosphate-dependent aminotransferase [Chloroflexota bacterium]|nr:pyridoxal phosphate-dependent aminotransferase [Chloroflexota bacterium]
MANSNISTELVQSYSYKDLDGEAVKASYSALKSGQTHYVDVPGIPELRAAAAEYAMSHGVQNVTSDNIIITSGVQESRFLASQVVTAPGGKVALPKVAHPGNRLALSLRGCQLYESECDEQSGWLMASDMFNSDSVVGSDTVLIENPSRFSGAIYQSNLLGKLGVNSQTAVIDIGLSPWLNSADQAMQINLEDPNRSVIAVGELWPGLGIEPQGLGFIAAPMGIAEKIVSMKQVLSICTSTAAQYAALEVSTSWSDDFEKVRANLQSSRTTVDEALGQMGVEVLASSVSCFITVKGIEASQINSLVEATGSALTGHYESGSIFGVDAAVQFAVSASTD